MLSFFQAEVERTRASTGKRSVIYAIEEPETSQHPTNQQLVIEALKEMASNDGCQVLLTTHVPGLAAMLPVQGIRHITQDSAAQRAIASGDGIIQAIAKDLGVVPDLQDHRVQVLLCLEGPTDVDFFTNIARVLRAGGKAIPELGTDPRIAMIPLGGGTLKDWVNKRYLRDLSLPEVHIYDNDVAGYGDSVKEVNERGDGSFATLTKKREIENYLDSAAILKALGIGIAVTDTNDVPHEARTILKKKRVNGRAIKRILAEDGARDMTLARLKARGGLDEIESWFAEIAKRLRPPLGASSGG